jgi:hypothetical protein
MRDQRFVSPTILAFAILGLIGGLLSWSVFGYAPAAIVVTTPLLCTLIGVVAAPRRFWWLLTAGLVPIAGALNGAAAALFAFGPGFGPGNFVRDGAYVGLIMSVPFLPALLFAGWMARSLRRARPKSLVAGIDARRFSWTVAFVATSASAFVVARSYNSGAPAAAMVSGAALLVMLFVGVRSLMAFLRVREAMRLATFLRPAQPSTGAQRDDEYLDLGVGDAQYVYVDPATLLRGAPTATLLLEGDPLRSLPIARNALLLSAFGVALALGVFIIASVHTLRAMAGR